MIRAVFFDVDDTLVDFGTAARAAFAAVFGAAADWSAWSAMSQGWLARHPGELSWSEARVGRTAEFLRSLHRDDDAAAVEERRMSLIEASLQVFPDVSDCLRALRASGVRLGVITNSDPEYQRRKLRSAGLGDAFHAVVISGEVGVRKPDRAIFEHACEQLGVEAAAAAHVGDLLDVDALGAASAGLRGVWLDRHGAAPAPGVPTISTLGELPGLVA